MIDLGLTKMALIGVIALVVIGPEKLPRVARMAGTLFGRAQRYINQVKAEVSREIELDELRKMHQEVEEAATHAGAAVKASVGQLNDDIHTAWQGKHIGNDDNNDVNNDDNMLSTHGDARSAAALDRFAIKSKDFRKKRLIRTTATPSWYKHQHGQRSRVISGAARVARFRPTSAKAASFFSN
jgi:sec-independent protein translocase protein TatB